MENKKIGMEMSMFNTRKKRIGESEKQDDSNVKIRDVRDYNDFKNVSFSGYRRSAVKASLKKSLFDGKVEEANYWIAELLCCFLYLDVWEILLEFMSLHIHTANPKLAILYVSRYEKFKKKAIWEYSENPIEMRNDQEIRRIFCEITSLCCLSRKRNKLEYLKIGDEDEFDLVNMTRRLMAPSTYYAQKILRPGDPTEITVAINEFGYALSAEVKNAVQCAYWLEWIYAFEKKCKKNKTPCVCIRRDFAPTDGVSGLDISFVIWDAIMMEIERRMPKLVTVPLPLKLVCEALLHMYKIRFAIGKRGKRKHLLYFAITLLCDGADFGISPISNGEVIKTAVKNLDIIYAEVKKNEVLVKKKEENELDLRSTEGKLSKTMDLDILK